MTDILYGAPVAEKILAEVYAFAQAHPLTLATVGFNNPQWQQYVRALQKTAQKCNIAVQNVVVEEVSPDEFAQCVRSLCAQNVNGVLVQQPLPAPYAAILDDCLAFAKDIDCITSQSIARLYKGQPCLPPATPLAVLQLLDYYHIDLTGKNVVIVGRGNAVGKPLSLMCLKRNATVTVCHTKTVNLAQICRRADVIISACGVAGLITKDFVTPNSIVIDVGLSFVDGKTCGDVSPDVQQIAAAVSPVPGGIGPVTRATLFFNLLQVCKQA